MPQARRGLSPGASARRASDDPIFVGVGTRDDPEIAAPDVRYGAEGELSWMRRDEGLARLRIDTDDLAGQNALLERILRHAGV